MTQRPEPHLLTAGECAESLGITDRSFRSWGVEPTVIVGTRKYFDGRAILDNRTAALKRKRRRPESTTAQLKVHVDELETALTTARAEGQSLRNAELRQEMVHLDRLTQAIATGCTAANAALEALPGKVKRASPEVTGQELTELRAIIARVQNRAAGLDTSILDYEAAE